MTIRWHDAEDIALALVERYPDIDPLTVRFTDLHRWVTELPGFADDVIRYTRHYSWALAWNKTSITVSSLGRDAQVYGAVELWSRCSA